MNPEKGKYYIVKNVFSYLGRNIIRVNYVFIEDEFGKEYRLKIYLYDLGITHTWFVGLDYWENFAREIKEDEVEAYIL